LERTSAFRNYYVTVSGVIPQIWGIGRQIGERILVIGDSPTCPNSSPNLGYFDENWGKKKLELDPLLCLKIPTPLFHIITGLYHIGYHWTLPLVPNLLDFFSYCSWQYWHKVI